jgi:hypothetical protein
MGGPIGNVRNQRYCFSHSGSDFSKISAISEDFKTESSKFSIRVLVGSNLKLKGLSGPPMLLFSLNLFLMV